MLVVIGFGLAIMILHGMSAEAEELARKEWKQLQELERKKATAAALELSERRKIEHRKALAVARADYPQYVDEDELTEREWWDNGDDKEEIIAAHLDPADVILKYRVAGDTDDSVIRLYERGRVDTMERTASAIIQQRGLVRARRERLEQRRRQEEEQARLAEEEERQLAERLAQQKIIHIDERLK